MANFRYLNPSLTIENSLVEEFREAYPDIAFKKEEPIPMIKKIYDETNIKFVFIIDEWDCPFRERKGDADGNDDYLVFLRSLFKEQRYVALAYMTGILPVKNFVQTRLSTCSKSIR